MVQLHQFGSICCLFNGLVGLGIFDVPLRFQRIANDWAAFALVTMVAGITMFAAWQLVDLTEIGPGGLRESMIGKKVQQELHDIVWTFTNGVFRALCFFLCLVYMVEVILSFSHHFAFYLSQSDSGYYALLLVYAVLAVGGNLLSICQLEKVHIVSAVLRVAFAGLVTFFYPMIQHTVEPQKPDDDAWLESLPLLMNTFLYHLVMPGILYVSAPSGKKQNQAIVVFSSWAMALFLGIGLSGCNISQHLLAHFRPSEAWETQGYSWVPSVSAGLIVVQILSCSHVFLRAIGDMVLTFLYGKDLDYIQNYGRKTQSILTYIFVPLLIVWIPAADKLLKLGVFSGVTVADHSATVTLVLVYLIVPYCFLQTEEGKSIGMRVLVFLEFAVLLAAVLGSFWNNWTHFLFFFGGLAVVVVAILIIKKTSR